MLFGFFGVYPHMQMYSNNPHFPSFLHISCSLLLSSASLLHTMRVTQQGQSSSHVKESRMEPGFMIPVEARMQNGDEHAFLWTPNWKPFKIPTEDQSWFSSEVTRGLRGANEGFSNRERWQEHLEQPETSSINLHMKRFSCKNIPILNYKKWSVVLNKCLNNSYSKHPPLWLVQHWHWSHSYWSNIQTWCVFFVCFIPTRFHREVVFISCPDRWCGKSILERCGSSDERVCATETDTTAFIIQSTS